MNEQLQHHRLPPPSIQSGHISLTSAQVRAGVPINVELQHAVQLPYTVRVTVTRFFNECDSDTIAEAVLKTTTTFQFRMHGQPGSGPMSLHWVANGFEKQG